MQHLKSKRHEERWVRASRRQSEKEMEELHHNIDALLQEKKDLEHEVEELHRTIQKHQQRKDFIDGNVESLMTELEIEKSLKHQENIIDEIECIEKTLLKRRSELREADRSRRPRASFRAPERRQKMLLKSSLVPRKICWKPSQMLRS